MSDPVSAICEVGACLCGDRACGRRPTPDANRPHRLPFSAGPPVALPTGMLLALLPLVAASMGTPDDTVVTTSPRSAQVRLADLLADADEIDGVRAHDQTFTFSIMRGDEPYAIVASTSAEGDVIDVVLRERVRSRLDRVRPILCPYWRNIIVARQLIGNHGT